MDFCRGVSSIALVMLILTFRATSLPPEQKSGNKLLVIVLDGYRWNYQTWSYPGFHHLRRNGVEAEYLHPSFPTVTMPNLQSIMTGLYPETHGIVGDYMYDIETDTAFSKMTNSTLDSDAMWWNSGDPFWIAATRQGKRAYMYHWPGCDVFIHGIKPTFCKPIRDWHVDKDDFRLAARESIKLFTNDSADFIGIFYTEPDTTGHMMGTRSVSLENTISLIDEVIASLLRQLDDVSYHDVTLGDVTDIMIMSTHGMTNISPRRVVNVSGVLDMTNVRHVVTDHTMLQIWPLPGKEEDIINNLNGTVEHAHIYRKEELPDYLHYKKGQYVAPLLLLVDPGYTLLTPDHPTFPTVTSTVNKGRPWAGNHGYDSVTSSDMRGIFMAKGPHFKKNQNFTRMENVCVYQIMCAILGIESSPHNGSWASVRDIVVDLKEPGMYSYPSHISKMVVVLIACAVIFSVVSAAWGLYCRREGIRNWMRHRGVEWQPLHDGVL